MVEQLRPPDSGDRRRADRSGGGERRDGPRRLLLPASDHGAATFGQRDFNELTFTINDALFTYGSVITAVIKFVAVAAAVFFFDVKPVDTLLRRFRSPVEEGMPDKERRHQELLAALRASR
jgi:hypothetical protein